MKPTANATCTRSMNNAKVSHANIIVHLQGVVSARVLHNPTGQKSTRIMNREHETVLGSFFYCIWSKA